jgi:hypothetical protein
MIVLKLAEISFHFVLNNFTLCMTTEQPCNIHPVETRRNGKKSVHLDSVPKIPSFSEEKLLVVQRCVVCAQRAI